MTFQIGNDVPFPIFNSRLSEVRLREVIDGEDGFVEVVNVLHSSSGNCYEIGRVLKTAIYGRVVYGTKLQGQHTLFRTSTHVAIKIITRENIHKLHGRIMEDPMNEIAAMQYIGNDHPNLVGQIECCKDDNNIYSVMRFCSQGELFDMIELDGPMDEATARSMIFQVIVGLEQLQYRGIGHRDLSVENVLVDLDDITDELGYVIIDFGMCTMCPRRDEIPDTVEDHQLTPFSFKYVPRREGGKAPEAFNGDNASQFVNPMLCDIWALGIILFFCLTGEYPLFSAITVDPAYNLIVSEPNGVQQLLDGWQLSMPPHAVDLIQRMLRANPNDRITIPQIRNHPFMKN